MGQRYSKYNKTNTCEKIKENGEICGKSLVPKHTCREYDKNGDWTGKWICHTCHNLNYQRHNPKGSNILKKISDHRTGNLDPNSTHAKGDKFEELTSIWKGVKILSKENDNYIGPLDHSVDSEGKRLQTKGKLYNSTYRTWGFGVLDREWEKEFDYEICYCTSADGNVIERIYIIPKKEIKGKRSSITIYKYRVSGLLYKNGWYEQYRVKDEEVMNKVNEIWKEIISDK